MTFFAMPSFSGLAATCIPLDVLEETKMNLTRYARQLLRIQKCKCIMCAEQSAACNREFEGFRGLPNQVKERGEYMLAGHGAFEGPARFVAQPVSFQFLLSLIHI